MNGQGNWQEGRLDPGLFLRSQLAAEVGVSRDTIIRWHAEGLIKPVNEDGGGKGGGGYWVYDEQALARAKRLKALGRMNPTARRIILDAEFGKQGD